MPETKAIRIDVIPYLGKASVGNYEPVTLFFNIQRLDSGRSLGILGLDDFSASSNNRQLRALQMPLNSFQYEMSDLLKQRGDYVFEGTMKPKNLLPNENTAKRLRDSAVPMTGGWVKGIYIFWIKIQISPNDIFVGAKMFEFEIK